MCCSIGRSAADQALAPAADPFHEHAQESGRPYTRHVVGIRYLLNPNTALQLEGNHTREVFAEEKSYSELRAQIAIRF